MVEPLVQALSVPHLQVFSTHVLATDGLHPTAVAAVAPQRHWQIPKLDIAVNPVVHVTPEHGSKIRALPNL